MKRDRIENAIRHIQTATDVDPWAAELAVEALKAQLSEEETISDCISRQAAIDALCAVCGNDCDKSEFVYNAPQDEQVILCPEHYCLCILPSVQPERKTGHWIDGKLEWHGIVERYCSECGQRLTSEKTVRMKFCPNCGVKMEEGEAG